MKMINQRFYSKLWADNKLRLFVHSFHISLRFSRCPLLPQWDAQSPFTVLILPHHTDADRNVVFPPASFRVILHHCSVTLMCQCSKASLLLSVSKVLIHTLRPPHSDPLGNQPCIFQRFYPHCTEGGQGGYHRWRLHRPVPGETQEGNVSNLNFWDFRWMNLHACGRMALLWNVGKKLKYCHVFSAARLCEAGKAFFQMNNRY